jgi:hypothetical protein
MIGRQLFFRRSVWVTSTLAALLFSPLWGEIVVRKADEYGLFNTLPMWIADGLSDLISVAHTRWFIFFAAFGLGALSGYAVRSISCRPKPQGFETSARTETKTLVRPSQSKNAADAALELPEAIREVMDRSERDDFDLVADKLVVRCTRNDHGFDAPAIIFFKNRSQKPLHIKPLHVSFSIDDEIPEGQTSSGFSTPVSAGKTDCVRLRAIRLYNERPRSGKAEMTLMFGPNQNDLRCLMAVTYTFDINAYPANKSVDAVLNENTQVDVRYYVRRNED